MSYTGPFRRCPSYSRPLVSAWCLADCSCPPSHGGWARTAPSPGESVQCCLFDTHTRGSLHLVAVRSPCRGGSLPGGCDHVCHGGSAGHGEYSFAVGDAGARAPGGAGACVFLPVDVV